MNNLLKKTVNTQYQFLSGGGEMGALIRAKDWSKTALGNPEDWPQSLRTMVSVMLDNPFGMYIAWGSEYIQLYNDGYRPILGSTKHPQALGISTRKTFEEIWHIIESMFDGVMKGKAVGFPDFMLPLNRNGFVEDCYFDFSYSPIRKEDGEVGGVLVTVIETTNKKKAEKDLEESKEQLEFAIEATELGTFDYNPLTNKFSSNSRLKDWFGLPADAEIELHHAINALAEKDRQKVTTAIQKTLEYVSGGKYDKEYTIIHPVTKIETVVHAKGRAWFNDDKIAYRFNGTIKDITQEVKAREEIKLSEQRFHAAIDAIHGVLWTNNAEGKMVGEQPDWETLTGQTFKEYQGFGWANAVHPDDAQPTIIAWKEAVRDRKTFVFEHRLKLKNKSWGDFSIRAIPLLNSDGSIREWVGVHTDITERKQSEEILKNNEQKFRVLADSMPQFVWTGDAEGNLNYFNEAVYNYSGLSPEKIDTEGWIQIVHPEDKEENIKMWVNSIKTGKDFLFEHRFRRHDGEYRWQLSRAIPQKDSAGNIRMWVGTSTDIQQIKELDQQKDYFISMASHELKTPLTSIKGYVQMLGSMYSNGEDIFLKNSLKIVDKQIQTLTNLISDLLDLSKIKSANLSLNMEEFSGNELIRETIDEMEHINPDYTFIFSAEREIILFADRERIGQVLRNFFTNAVKYSPDNRTIQVQSIIKKGDALISVEDQGIGIKRNDQGKIFERFYRVEGKNEKTFPGFGIGLFICAEIIHRHNGKIGVKSEPGKGSLFYFSLPLTSSK